MPAHFRREIVESVEITTRAQQILDPMEAMNKSKFVIPENTQKGTRAEIQ
jgi:hypothetical protein